MIAYTSTYKLKVTLIERRWIWFFMYLKPVLCFNNYCTPLIFLKSLNMNTDRTKILYIVSCGLTIRLFTPWGRWTWVEGVYNECLDQIWQNLISVWQCTFFILSNISLNFKNTGLKYQQLGCVCLNLPVITFNTWKKQVLDTPKKKVSLNKPRINQ